jgi:hypothetical protein
MTQPPKKAGYRPQSVIMKPAQGQGQPQPAQPGVAGMMDPSKLISLMEQCLMRGFQIQTLRMIRRHITEPPSASWMSGFIAKNGPEVLFKLFKVESINVR